MAMRRRRSATTRLQPHAAGRARAGALDVPVRLLRGAQDAWQPPSCAARLTADIPGAELVVIDDAGHFLMEDQPARVRREILDFL